MVPDRHFRFNQAVILGATGPTGIHLASVLRSRDVRLQVVSRSTDHLQQVFSESGVECMAADAIREDEVERVLEGQEGMFDCIGLPAERMGQHPDTARNIARVVRRSGLRCVQVSSYWAYLPVANLPVNEEQVRLGGNEWVGQRRQAEDILQEAGAAILNLPDFYGPGVHMSTLQQPLREAAEGKTMNWFGPADVEREYVYVPDAMEIAADLATREEAYGQRWIVPGGWTAHGTEGGGKCQQAPKSKSQTEGDGDDDASARQSFQSTTAQLFENGAVLFPADKF